jgi:hypothetical protein
MRCSATRILGALFSTVLFCTSIQAADKIRIGYPGPAASFIPLCFDNFLDLIRPTYDSVAKAFNEDGSVPEDGLRLVIEEAKKAANITRAVAPSEVADLSILREAQKEFGIKGK